MKLVATLRVSIKFTSHFYVFRAWFPLDLKRITWLNGLIWRYKILSNSIGVSVCKTDFDVFDALYLIEVVLTHFEISVFLFGMAHWTVVLPPRYRRWITRSILHFLCCIEQYLIYV